MNIALLFKLLPYLFQLIGLAEKLFNQPKSGEAKKAFVIDTAALIVNGLATESEGGQKSTWDAIKAPVTAIIDNTVKIVNATGGFGVNFGSTE